MNKTTIFCLILLGIILPMNAQIYTPNGAIQGSSNSNVGIGTATPESGYKIDVNGSATIGNTGSTRVYVGTLDANTSYLQSRNTTINKNLSIFADNVGIGTTTPSEKLHVIGNGFFTGQIKSNNGSFGGTLNLGDVTYLTSSFNGYAKLVYNMHNGGGYSDVMSINGNGNVGIGTVSPNSNLQIYSNSSPANTLTGQLQIGGSNNVMNDIYLSIGTNKSGEYAFINGAKGGIGNIPLALMGGNVGIGTTNPTSKLTVAGNINSREVKVTVDAGADFVFAEDYTLPSLDSIENYIKENKHLPEIASAKEMQTNGINLSEMNIKLLQKMEEMTLYMIEQSKEIERLKIVTNSYKVLSERLLKIENKIK